MNDAIFERRRGDDLLVSTDRARLDVDLIHRVLAGTYWASGIPRDIVVRAIAGSILKKLAAKGYPAFLVNPSANATPSWYKVQVGRYKDRGEAEKVSLRIKKEEQYQSWITR